MPLRPMARLGGELASSDMAAPPAARRTRCAPVTKMPFLGRVGAAILAGEPPDTFSGPSSPSSSRSTSGPIFLTSTSSSSSTAVRRPHQQLGRALLRLLGAGCARLAGQPGLQDAFGSLQTGLVLRSGSATVLIAIDISILDVLLLGLLGPLAEEQERGGRWGRGGGGDGGGDGDGGFLGASMRRASMGEPPRSRWASQSHTLFFQPQLTHQWLAMSSTVARRSGGGGGGVQGGGGISHSSQQPPPPHNFKKQLLTENHKGDGKGGVGGGGCEDLNPTATPTPTLTPDTRQDRSRWTAQSRRSGDTGKRGIISINNNIDNNNNNNININKQLKSFASFSHRGNDIKNLAETQKQMARRRAKNSTARPAQQQTDRLGIGSGQVHHPPSCPPARLPACDCVRLKYESPRLASVEPDIGQSFLRYFRKGSYFGLACFANMPVESELERGARMKSVGILSPSYTLLYRYMHFLENQALCLWWCFFTPEFLLPLSVSVAVELGVEVEVGVGVEGMKIDDADDADDEEDAAEDPHCLVRRSAAGVASSSWLIWTLSSSPSQSLHHMPKKEKKEKEKKKKTEKMLEMHRCCCRGDEGEGEDGGRVAQREVTL
ncbi:LOW QUALITY PROTEIN: hypothetical protein CRUP_005354 [Coryphaenoides rupestris]|nr:LOW QUALITY PROTEIN: hypothetical protein CRUP_005354 [Coryphaenoides rupestris]